MREINFRVWDTFYNKMLTRPPDYGTLDHIFDPNQLRWIYQQFTGLKDKNAKDIYEGDCLIWEEWQQEMWGNKGAEKPDIAVIEYSAPSFIWRWYRLGKPLSLTVPELEIHDTNHYEVVGNIYENPELLKVSK